VVYLLGASLRWMPIAFGAIRSRMKASEAQAQGSLAGYEQTVATALEETEGAFSDYTRRKRRNWRSCVSTRA
jgi:outer membrane protein, multidrug efflux system